MDPIRIAKDALRNLWVHKYLWFFGIFVATSTTGGSRVQDQGTDVGPLPGWFWPVMGLAAVLALAGLFMHVVSEAALIEGVRRNRAGEPFRIGLGMSVGTRNFGRVLGIKLAALLTFAVTAAVVAAPALLGVAKLIPLALGIAVTVPLALVAVPWLLTVYFIYMYSLRFAVLDGRRAAEAIRDGRAFLHGRVLDSLKLLLVEFAGQVGGALVAVVAILPAALIGVALYFLAGLVPAAVVGGLLVLPIALAVAGALGTYRSSIWTLGFLEERGSVA